MREKSISVRFAAVGGQAVKAEMREIGASGKQAMQGIAAGTGPATDRLEQFGWVAAQARAQLEQLAAKSAASAAALRTTSAATTAMQQQVNRATGVSSPTGLSAAEMLQQGQALDDLRARFNPLFGVIRQYRAELSEVRAAHLSGAVSAEEMAEATSKLRQQALASIDKIKGTSVALREKAAAAKAAAVADQEAAAAAARQAQALDDMRAKINPLYAVIRGYKSEVGMIRQAHADGAISADEMSAALAKVRTAALASIDKIKGITAALKEKEAAAKAAAAADRQQAAALEAMRAKYNPVYAVIRRYKDEVASVRAAHQAGALSADEMTAAINRLRTASLGQIAMLKGQTEQVEQMSRETRGATLRMQQMFFQVNDIGVSLAGGMNPFVVMAQQGTQIAQLYGYGGGGVAGIFQDLGGLITSIPGPLKAVGVAAALGALGILDMRNAINETSAVTVTFGDTALAVFQVLGDRLLTLFDPILDGIGTVFGFIWERLTIAVKQTGNDVMNATALAAAVVAGEWKRMSDIAVAAYTGIRDVWGQLPAAIGDFAYSAANSLISGVESMLNAVVARINSFINMLNGALSKLPEWATPDGGIAIGTLSEVSLGGISNPYAGAGKAMADVAAKIAEAASQTNEGWANAGEIMSRDPMGQFFDDVSAQAQENARKRLEKDKKGGKGGGAAKAEKDEVGDLIKKLQEELLILRETDPVKKRLLEYSEEMSKATAAEKAQIEQLVRQLDKAENGFEAIGRAMASYAEESKRLGDEWGASLVDVFDGAADAFGAMVTGNKANWRDMVQSMAADWAKLAFQEHIGGPLAAMASGWLGSFGAGGDKLSSALGAAGVPIQGNYEGGGWTGNGARTGGLDGKGGFLAILHPQERIEDTTRSGRGAGRRGEAGGHVSVGIDPRNGNITAYIDRRISAALPEAFAAYSSQALPYAIKEHLADPRSIG